MLHELHETLLEPSGRGWPDRLPRIPLVRLESNESPDELFKLIDDHTARHTPSQLTSHL